MEIYYVYVLVLAHVQVHHVNQQTLFNIEQTADCYLTSFK